jgi:hypothetical protein
VNDLLGSEQATLRVIAALDALKISYMVVGSLSTNLYGIPRSTKDADFVVQLGSATPGQIASQLGSPFMLEPQSRFESVTATVCHRIAVKDSAFKIELFELSADAHDQERFRRRVRVQVSTEWTWAPTAEDVVITKLRWASRSRRGKDRDDVQNVLAVSGANLDWDYIHRWSDAHGTRQLLDEIRRSIGTIE